MAGGGRASPFQQRTFIFSRIFATRGPFIVSAQRGHRGDSAVLSAFAQSRVLLTPPIFLKGWIAADLRSAPRNQRQRLSPSIIITIDARLSRQWGWGLATDPGKIIFSSRNLSRRENNMQKITCKSWSLIRREGSVKLWSSTWKSLTITDMRWIRFKNKI